MGCSCGLAGSVRCFDCRVLIRAHKTPCRGWESEPNVYEQAHPFRSDRSRWVCERCFEPAGRPAIPAAVRKAVIARDGMVCQLCSVQVVVSAIHRPDRLHLDHILRWVEGGQHSIDNLRVACAACNLRRKKRSEAR